MNEPDRNVPTDKFGLRRKDDVEDLLDRAAERGAALALKRLGLESDDAAQDIQALRNLLDAWRDARRTAQHTAIKIITTAVLMLLLTGLVIKLKLYGGGQ